MRKLLIILILLTVTGGHWALLQSVAWAGMLITNLRHDSLQTAVSQTFDGKHACPLCRAIEHAKKSENKTEFVIKITHFEFTCDSSHSNRFADRCIGPALFSTDSLSPSPLISPLLRPPRRCCA